MTDCTSVQEAAKIVLLQCSTTSLRFNAWLLCVLYARGSHIYTTQVVSRFYRLSLKDLAREPDGHPSHIAAPSHRCNIAISWYLK
jgi:hypothetical protein